MINKINFHKNGTLVFFSVVVSVAFLILAINFLLSFSKNSGDSSNPPDTVQESTPAPIITSVEPQKGTGADVGPLSQSDKENRGYLLSLLESKLPYQGTNFSLSYDYDTDKFTLNLRSGKENEGNSEYQQYLKQNNILDTSWIKNITTTKTP